MSHTPGPWVVFQGFASDAMIFSILPAGRAGEITGNIENGPDADLIAAAPTMYEELKHLREVSADMLAALKAIHPSWTDDSDDPVGLQIRAAIAKAEPPSLASPLREGSER